MLHAKKEIHPSRPFGEASSWPGPTCKIQEIRTAKRRLENQLLSWCRNPVRMSAFFEQSPQVGDWIRSGKLWSQVAVGLTCGFGPKTRRCEHVAVAPIMTMSPMHLRWSIWFAVYLHSPWV